MDIKKLIAFLVMLGFGLYSFIAGLLLTIYFINLILLGKDYGFGPMGLFGGIILSVIGIIFISVAIYILKLLKQNKA